jgi:hypothetical protein
MKRLSKLVLLICCGASCYSYGQETTTNKEQEPCGATCMCDHGTQTPLGVTTDHVHPKGEWMASYTFMNMGMKGNRSGTNYANDNDVYLQGYMMSPETMNMQMHMVMLMYGLTDKITLMGMGGIVSYDMKMNMDMSMTSMPGMPAMAPGNTTMSSMSSGITNTKLYGLFNVSDKEAHRIIASVGVSLPTGTIRTTGTTMLGDNQRLPYDMQPGTGSFSVLPGITYIRQYRLFSLGADGGADVKLNNNSLGYKQGNVYHATAWASRKLLPFVSGSLRAEGLAIGKISGSDPTIAIPIYETYDPTASTANYGGTVVNIYAGLNFHFSQPVLEKFQLLCEYGMPVYQNLNGTQMSYHSNLLAGLQYRF